MVTVVVVVVLVLLSGPATRRYSFPRVPAPVRLGCRLFRLVASGVPKAVITALVGCAQELPDQAEATQKELPDTEPA